MLNATSARLSLGSGRVDKQFDARLLAQMRHHDSHVFVLSGFKTCINVLRRGHREFFSTSAAGVLIDSK